MSVSQVAPLPGRIWSLLGSRLVERSANGGLITVVGLQIFDITGEELSLGLIGLAEFFPTFVLAPFSGTIADRFDRRRLTAFGALGFVVVSLLMFLYVRTDPTASWPIYLIMFGYGIVRAFQTPASRALPIDMAPEDSRERVVALSSASWQAGAIVGPVLFSFLYAWSRPLPFLVLAGFFAVSVVMLLALPSSGVERLLTGKPGPRQAIRDAAEGLRFVRNAPVVGGAILLDLFAVLLGGAVALLPAIAEKRLGVGPVGVGWLRAATGIGAASVTLVLAARPLTRRVGPVLMVAVGIFGAATIVLGLTRNFVVAFIAVLVLGGSDSVSVFIRATLVPLATPENMRGRVLALESVFIGASNELGAFESGVTAAWFGLAGAVVFGGAGTLVVVAGFCLFFPALRSIDRFADARPDGVASVQRN